MKSALFMILFMSCFCAVSTAQTMTTGVDILTVLSGKKPPEANLLYKLDSVQVLQIIDGGVLISLNPLVSSQSHLNTDIAFIATGEKFAENALLIGRWAYYTGQYKYKSVSGAERNVNAFKMYDKNKGKDLNRDKDLSSSPEQMRTAPNSPLENFEWTNQWVRTDHN